jgi:hypothetical protein
VTDLLAGQSWQELLARHSFIELPRVHARLFVAAGVHGLRLVLGLVSGPLVACRAHGVPSDE